uniref:Uncharacterized protein n=1 Tax=Arundo donax TaxID=35708 RepID=A0A0A9A5R6_ARUDO
MLHFTASNRYFEYVTISCQCVLPGIH